MTYYTPYRVLKQLYPRWSKSYNNNKLSIQHWALKEHMLAVLHAEFKDCSHNIHMIVNHITITINV